MSGSMSSGSRSPVKLFSPSTHWTPSTASISSIIFVLSRAESWLSTISTCTLLMLNSSDSFLLAMALSSVSGRPLSML